LSVTTFEVDVQQPNTNQTWRANMRLR
jgi:hypothetical protein